MLKKESRESLFNFLKEKNNCKSFKELSVKINFPLKTLQNWRLGYLYLPTEIIPKEFTDFKITDQKEENWGQVKGGKIGGVNAVESMKKRLGKEKYSEMKREHGKKMLNTIWKRYGKNEVVKMASLGRAKSRENKSKNLELENQSFFTNEKILLDISSVQFSKNDLERNIVLPKEMSLELAEETGIHLGDGCLSINRKYFSVKTNKKEEGYMLNFLFPLYKKLYNLDLRLMRLPSVVGFEICSKALFNFKNKTLNIPYGNKVEKIKVPQTILESKNKGIYSAFIRGLFDTDGCVYMVKSKDNYPVLSFTIKSEQLMKEVAEMLRKMGFIPYQGKHIIALNGYSMLAKWKEEIGSNNPKNLLKLQQANS